MEHNLDNLCNKFLIKLSPNFVSFVLKSDELKKMQADVASRFFLWASRQKKYRHKIESYVHMIDLLVDYGDLDRVKGVFDELKRSGLLMTVSAANCLVNNRQHFCKDTYKLNPLKMYMLQQTTFCKDTYKLNPLMNTRKTSYQYYCYHLRVLELTVMYLHIISKTTWMIFFSTTINYTILFNHHHHQ